jgi:hypothetical protein
MRDSWQGAATARASAGNGACRGAWLLAAFLVVQLPAPVRAETLSFTCAKAPNTHVLPLAISIDTVGKKVTYQLMEPDGVKPWSKLRVSAVTISPDKFLWNANPATDVPTRKYELDRKTREAIATDFEHGGTKRIVWDSWICQPAK